MNLNEDPRWRKKGLKVCFVSLHEITCDSSMRFLLLFLGIPEYFYLNFECAWALWHPSSYLLTTMHYYTSTSITKQRMFCFTRACCVFVLQCETKRRKTDPSIPFFEFSVVGEIAYLNFSSALLFGFSLSPRSSRVHNIYTPPACSIPLLL